MLHPAHRLLRDPFPYDPLLLDYWYPNDVSTISFVSGSPDTIRGGSRSIGTILTASSPRPAIVKADLLKGALGIRCNGASATYMANTAAGTYVASGTRPYTISVIRGSAAIGGSVTWGVFVLGVSGASQNHYIFYQTPAGPDLSAYYNGGAARVEASTPYDQLPHTIEFWADGTNLNCRDNGVLYQLASNVSLTANCSCVAFGRAASSAVQVGDLDHHFHAAFSAKPSDGYIMKVKMWLWRNLGRPPL